MRNRDRHVPYTLLPYQGSLLPVSIWVANINILTTTMIGYDAILKLIYDCTYRNRPRDLSVGPKVDAVDKSTLNLTICCWLCCIQADPEKISPNFVCTSIVRPPASETSEPISCTHIEPWIKMTKNRPMLRPIHKSETILEDSFSVLYMASAYIWT